jgi:hypothetical protein
MSLVSKAMQRYGFFLNLQTFREEIFKKVHFFLFLAVFALLFYPFLSFRAKHRVAKNLRNTHYMLPRFFLPSVVWRVVEDFVRKMTIMGHLQIILQQNA